MEISIFVSYYDAINFKFIMKLHESKICYIIEW